MCVCTLVWKSKDNLWDLRLSILAWRFCQAWWPSPCAVLLVCTTDFKWHGGVFKWCPWSVCGCNAVLHMSLSTWGVVSSGVPGASALRLSEGIALLPKCLWTFAFRSTLTVLRIWASADIAHTSWRFSRPWKKEMHRWKSPKVAQVK